MTTILVPSDGSTLAEQAVPYARALLGEDGTLLLVRVVPEPEPLSAGLTGVVATADEVGAIWQQAAAVELAGVAERSGIDPARIQTAVAMGEPAAEIVRIAAERGVDAIAMASHGRGAIGRAIFGSVADRVARIATVPVLIVRPGPQDPAVAALPLRRLVVPLDGSELAEEALPVAADLSRRLSLPVHLVRAVDPVTALPSLPTIEPVAPITPEVSERVYEEIEAEARASLARAADRLRRRSVAATDAVLTGSPYFAIAESLATGDLLVMTSHGRGGVRRWLLGSVAEKLVREGPAPVLLVPSSGRAELAAAG